MPPQAGKSVTRKPLRAIACLGLLLLFVGAAVLIAVELHTRDLQRQIAAYRLRYSQEVDKYLQQYTQWLQQPPEQRSASPFSLYDPTSGKTQDQLRAEQHARLKADIDRLASGQLEPPPFAELLYGPDWQTEVRRYRKQQRITQLLFTGSVVCTSVGATLCVGALLFWSVRTIISSLSRFKKTLARLLGLRQGSSSQDDESYDPPEDHPIESPQNRLRHLARCTRRSKILQNSGWRNCDSGLESRRKPLAARGTGQNQPNQPTKSTASRAAASGLQASHSSEQISMLLSDQKTPQTASSPDDRLGLAVAAQAQSSAGAELTGQPNGQIEDAIDAHREQLERQIDEFRRVAQSVQKAAIEQSRPLNEALRQLTEQVAAIRDYAAAQQQRMEKLQDGYDWNIIRTFCLKIIRCIDNLDARIKEHAANSQPTADLEEIRDELLFALESSGIEPFEPELNSDYRGQEKYAEAVKQRQPCKDRTQAGKIAEVIRPGYRYLINDSDAKIVRTAQVKLFG